MNESVCLQCENKRICATGVKQPNERIIVGGCSRFEQKKTITNADRIRSMTDDELASVLLDERCSFCDANNYSVCKSTKRCHEEIESWLKDEAKDG